MRHGNSRREGFEADFVAGPFLAGPLTVKAEGGEGLAERAKRATMIVIAAGDPVLLIVVGGVESNFCSPVKPSGVDFNLLYCFENPVR